MDEWSGRKWEPVTEERLLRAIDVLVDLAKEHGPNFDPVLESVRQELHAFRRRAAFRRRGPPNPGCSAAQSRLKRRHVGASSQGGLRHSFDGCPGSGGLQLLLPYEAVRPLLGSPDMILEAAPV